MNRPVAKMTTIDRRGFTIYLVFLVMFLVLYSGFLTQSIEILDLAQMQTTLLSKENQVKPGTTWYLETLLGPAEINKR